MMIPTSGPVETDKDWALFYGIMIGDGCLSRCGRGRFVVISCSMYDDRPFFDDLVVPLVRKLRNKDVKYKICREYGKIEINFSDKTLFEKVRLLDFPVGKKGQITISGHFSRDLWKHIIAGIFSTDGSLVIKNNNNTIYPRIEIQSISSGLLEQVKGFLTDCGLKGNVYRIDRVGFNAAYRLEFPGETNLMKFKDKIGFVNPKHEDKLNHYLKERHLEWREWSWNKRAH